ncbi:MAG: HAD hydrolase-like protein [Solobacterium sp.]|nr:HAD hydrolase-like protein [Solobacterium sp.]
MALNEQRSMRDLSAVVFDVDGTLLNTEFLWNEVWNHVGLQYGCPAFGQAHLYRTFREDPVLYRAGMNRLEDCLISI